MRFISVVALVLLLCGPTVQARAEEQPDPEALAAATDPGSLPERIAAAVAAGGLFFLVALAYPRGMGLGDVKLAATMGLFLGRNVAPAIVIALLAGSLVGLVMIARDGAAARKQAIPFGPFLALGGVVGLLAGDQIVDWYLGTF